MLAIVESGSTKADWSIIKGENQMKFHTQGFNPFFHDENDVLFHLENHRDLKALRGEVKQIYFYGAGCSSPDLNKKILKGLSTFFYEAIVEVDHDLKASALALYEGDPIVACILGTGSNSCFFDGFNISEERPALGYILGDEGSGCYFGKRLFRDLLYQKLPVELEADLVNAGFNKSLIFEAVYSGDAPNVFIASAAKYLVRHKSLEYSQKIISEGLNEFIDQHVLCYGGVEDLKVGFVGSIAKVLEDELYLACSKRNLQMGRIIQRPLDYLVEYHLKRRETIK